HQHLHSFPTRRSSDLVRVPTDLSIAALDDSYPAEQLTPPLTAVRAPLEQMAAEAATLLVEQIESRQSPLPRRMVLRPTLMVRESDRKSTRLNSSHDQI